MPIIPASLSGLNSKVESARKSFNSSLDKAGEKTGVFKPTNTNSSSSSSQKISSNRIYDQPPNYSSSNQSLNHPPPPPPPPPRQPPPVRRHAPVTTHQKLPPPPPPRQIQSNSLIQNYNESEQLSYDPPPPVPSKPTTPYRPPTESFNGYGPPSFPPATETFDGYGTPSFPPVQPSHRYGPPSPPRSPTHAQYFNPTALPPVPVSSTKPPMNWNKPDVVPQPEIPPRSIGAKHGQIPFPPFSQFTQNDKVAFFDMLDEFFALRFPDRKPSDEKKVHAKYEPHAAMALLTRPSNQASVNLDESGPSRAESLARYFKNYRQWSSHTDQWYNSSDPGPTPEQESTDLKRTSCWSQTGSNRTQINYILFPDLSQIWTQVLFDVNQPFPPRSASARYRPPPEQIDSQNLIEASEIYGSQIVLFAENAERSRCHVARGECWDLANEALKAFPASRLRVPPPLTSISRTHGILLYYGRSSGQGVGIGNWKQSNDFGVIRPGDIIEWRLVACNTVNPTLSCTLGDPEHTAIIVEATGCTINANNGYPDNSPPYQLGHITVIEQSLKQIPARQTYNLSSISRGEVWIYRPMAEQFLLGSGANECSFPPPPPSFEP